MSDFLTSLAARTLASPPLRPRLRMRFEPEAGELAQPILETSRERAAPAVHATRAIDEPAAASQQPRAEVPHRDAAPRASEPQATAPRETTRTIHDERATQSHHVERVDRLEQIETRVTNTIETPPRETPAKPPRPLRIDEEPPRLRRDEAASPAAIERTTRDHVIEHVRASQPRTLRENAAAATTPAEPVVQVSIGRIEVRATTAPAPRGGTRARSTMSIDDYVAKRDARERR